jgi:hypothetical protein
MADNKIVDDYYSQIEEKKEEKPKATTQKVVAKKVVIKKVENKKIEENKDENDEKLKAKSTSQKKLKIIQRIEVIEKEDKKEDVKD